MPPCPPPATTPLNLQENIRTLNFTSDFGFNSIPKHKRKKKRIKRKLVFVGKEWNRLPIYSLPTVVKAFQIEKFLGDFFSSISSLNISPLYMYVPYKTVPNTMACIRGVFNGQWVFNMRYKKDSFKYGTFDYQPW